MKNIYIAIAIAIISTTKFAVFGETMTPEERAAHKAAVVAKVGGLLPRLGTPAGRIAFVNAQNVVPVEAFKETFAKNSSRVRGVDYWTECKDVNVGNALELKKEQKAQFALFIVDSESLPMSLIAPEENWAIMNVRPLAAGNVKKELAVHRAKNEFARVFGLLCGGVSSQFPSAIMNGVMKPSDLNACTDDLPVDITAKMTAYAEGRGVKAEQLTSYQKACQEGWAPAPTNEVQKAIWEKVKAEQSEKPSNPIRIRPGDKPKGK